MSKYGISYIINRLDIHTHVRSYIHIGGEKRKETYINMCALIE